jgi:hypothetical protein
MLFFHPSPPPPPPPVAAVPPPPPPPIATALTLVTPAGAVQEYVPGVIYSDEKLVSYWFDTRVVGNALL